MDERGRIAVLLLECLQRPVGDRIAAIPALIEVNDHPLVERGVHLVLPRKLRAGEQAPAGSECSGVMKASCAGAAAVTVSR